MDIVSKIQIKLLDNRINIPSKATTGSAGFDLQACIDEELILMPGEAKLVPTGLAIHIDKKQHVAFILPRSKVGARKGIVLGNLTGVIDSDYQGQWFVSVWNRNFNEPVSIQPLEQIAQAVFLKLAEVEFDLIGDEDFTAVTERKDGGISKTVDTTSSTLIDSEDFTCPECGSSKFLSFHSIGIVECAHCSYRVQNSKTVNIKHQRG